MKKYKVYIFLGAVSVAGFLFASSFTDTNAFTGPSTSAGLGSGAIGVDASNNISVGTSTPSAGTKMLIVASSTDNSNFGLRVIQPNGNPVLVIRNDGNVGVGTVSLGSPLTVQGNIFVSGSFLGGSIGADQIMSGKFASSTGGGHFSFPASIGIATSSNVSLPQSLSVYGGGYFSGSVGIGTTSPARKLVVPSVNMKLSTAGGALFSSSQEDGGVIIGSDNVVGSIQGTNAAGTTAKNLLLQAEGGLVGIGTTGPQRLLHILGGNSPGLRLENNGATTGNYEFLVNNNGDFELDETAVAARIFVKKTTGNVGIGTTNPTSTLSVVGEIKTTGAGGGIRFPDNTLQTTAGGGASQWTTTSTGIFYNSGNVGAGTTAPQSKLHASVNVAGAGASAGLTLENIGGTLSPNLQFKNTGGSRYIRTSNTDLIFLSNGGSPVATFSDNGDTSFTGNLSLGGLTLTSAFSTTLNINSTGANFAGQILLTGRTGGVNAMWIVQSRGGLDVPNNRFSIFDTGSTERVTILTGGNVGIGTTNPTSTLSVVGEIKTTGAGGGIRFPDNTLQTTAAAGGGGVGGSGTLNSIPLWTPNGTTLGNSLITQPNGTTIAIGLGGLSVGNTNAQLAGQIYATGNIITSGQFAGFLPAEYLMAGKIASSTGGGNFSFPLGGKVGIATSSNFTLPQELSVYGGGYFSGNVGIGTTNPGQKLRVVSGDGVSRTSQIGVGRFSDAESVPLYEIQTADADASFGEDALFFYGGRWGNSAWFVRGSSLGDRAYARIRNVGATASELSLFDASALTGGNTNVHISTAGNSYFNGGNVGIGTAGPTAKLSVAPGSQLTGTAMSTAFVVSAGNLGTTAGNELALASFGNIQGNSAALGIRAYRVSNGLDWTTSAIGLGMDVDNTVRAGANIWLSNNGNVGIGTAGPGTKLDVGASTADTIRSYGGFVGNAAANIGGTGAAAYFPNGLWSNGASAWIYGNVVFNGALQDNAAPIRWAINPTGNSWFNGGNVGIGTIAPGQKLEVVGNVSSSALCLGGICNSTWPAGGVTSVFGRTGAVVAASGDYSVGQVTGAAPLASPTFTGNVTMPGTGIWNSSGNVGIGTSSPAYKLDVVGTGRFTGDVTLGDGVGKDLTIGGGTGMIDAGGMDPGYRISGKRYATYVPSFAGGVKEETAGVLQLKANNGTVVDFGSQPRGSDLWLFYQATDFGKDMEQLQVLLTPGFEGRAWYEKDPENNRIIIFGDRAGEVSYRLVANRFDWREWSNEPNFSEDTGFLIEEK